MKKIKYVMFDFDNTLVDSLKYWYGAIDKEAFIHFNSKVSKKFHSERKGKTNHGIVECFVKHVQTKVAVDEAEKFWHDRMIYYYRNKVKMIKGVIETLENLKSRGYNLVLASATPMNILMQAVDFFGLKKYFKKIYTENKFNLQKSNPEFYKKMLSDLKITADELFVFEDSVGSLESAGSLGIKSCALVHKFNKKRIEELGETNLLVIKNYKNKNLKNLPIF